MSMITRERGASGDARAVGVFLSCGYIGTSRDSLRCSLTLARNSLAARLRDGTSELDEDFSTGAAMKIAICTATMILLAGCASTPPVETAKDSPGEKHGSVRVIAHNCDGGQGVDTLELNVEGEGVVMIHWSNENVCGKPA